MVRRIAEHVKDTRATGTAVLSNASSMCCFFNSCCSKNFWNVFRCVRTPSRYCAARSDSTVSRIRPETTSKRFLHVGARPRALPHALRGSQLRRASAHLYDVGLALHHFMPMHRTTPRPHSPALPQTAHIAALSAPVIRKMSCPLSAFHTPAGSSPASTTRNASAPSCRSMNRCRDRLVLLAHHDARIVWPAISTPFFASSSSQFSFNPIVAVCS